MQTIGLLAAGSRYATIPFNETGSSRTPSITGPDFFNADIGDLTFEGARGVTESASLALEPAAAQLEIAVRAFLAWAGLQPRVLWDAAQLAPDVTQYSYLPRGPPGPARARPISPRYVSSRINPQKKSEIMFYPDWTILRFMALPRWVIGVILILTGCGGRSRPAAPLKLTVLGLTLEAGEQLKRDALDDYTRKTGVEVDLVPTIGNSVEQLGLMLKLFGRRSSAPDIYVVDLVWPATLREHLLDLTPHLNPESRSHFEPVLKSGTVGDRVFALPFYMSAGTLFYRADLLKKYGYSKPPQTWPELVRVASRIQEAERSAGRKAFWGYVWQGAPYEGLTCNALEWQASYGGGRILDDDGTVAINNARAIEALKTAASWVGTISPPGVIAYMETDSQNLFRSGNAAFLRYWSSGFRSTAAAMPPNSVAVAPLPSGPAGRAHTVGGFHLAVSRYSARAREAVALVQHLTSAEIQRRRALSRGFLPTYAHVYEHPDFARALPESRAVAEVVPGHVIVRPAVAAGNKYADVSKAYYQTVNAILAGQVRAEDAVASLDAALRALIAGQTRRQ